MKLTLHTILLIFLTATIVLSCGKEYSCEGCNTSNKPPIAIAGEDQIITLPIDSVLLNGTASNDPDGKITGWRWTKIGGPASFSISHLDSAITIARMLVQGIYQFELKVTDDKGASAKDTVQVTVNAASTTNLPPVACAGQDQTITLPVNSVMLDGSCTTDPNNNITSYLWTKISGPSSFSMANANLVQTQVTNLVEGTFQFQLKVTDAGGLFSMDTVQITVHKQVTTSTVDIYVAGEQNGVATYWKNGQPVSLTGSLLHSTATSIAVVGSDVYVVGLEGEFGFAYVAKYWKDGQEVDLTGGTSEAGATSIAIVGGNVYVAGWEDKGSKTVAKYWKNSQPVYLTDGFTDAYATCIVVVDGNVYVAGHENGVAKYWKNGQAVSLTNGLHQAYANSIAVVGSDVYVAGSESNGSAHVAKYWKNGQPVSLTNGSAVYSKATSIAVVGSDVYVAGWEGDFVGRVGGTGAVGKYWKNGQKVALTNGTTYGYPSSITLFGTDVYVGGTEWSAVGQPVAKYWKNGQSVTIATGAQASSILVVQR
jgi:hypothetical protein